MSDDPTRREVTLTDSQWSALTTLLRTSNELQEKATSLHRDASVYMTAIADMHSVPAGLRDNITLNAEGKSMVFDVSVAVEPEANGRPATQDVE